MLGAAHDPLDLTGWLWAERSSIVRAWEDQAGGPTDEAPDRKRVIEALARDLDGHETEPALRPAEAAALREAIFTRLEAAGARCEVATLRRLDRAIDRRVLDWAHSMRGPPTPEELPFRLLVDEVRDYAIFLLDPEGRVASWNRGAERIEGYRAEEILGQPFECFYPPEKVAAGLPREALAFARRHGRHEVVGQRVRKDGGRFWADVTITALYDETGNHLGYLEVTRDISERREAEEERTRLLASEREARELAEQRLAELRRSDARLRRIVDSNMVGVAFWSFDGGISEANDAFLGMLGLDQSDLAAGRVDWRRLTLPEYAAADAAGIETIRRHGQHPAYEKEFLHRDGHRVPVLIASASVPDEPEQGVSCILDMQPLHAAERRVRESEARLRAILAHAPVPIFIKDRREAYELVNPAWERMAGRTAAEVIGRTGREIFGGAVDDSLKRAFENDRRVLEGAETLVDAEERIRMGGREGIYRTIRFPLLAEGGEVRVVVGIGVDVTDEKERAEFERELIGIVSHDLKNPLAAVKVGAATLLRRADELDDQTRRVVGRIAASAERSLALIKDLLDFTRARRGGGIPIRPEPLDLDELVRRVVVDVHSIYPDREIRVHAAGAGRGSWDPARLTQVIDNLLVNALKYSPLRSTVQIETSGDENTVRLAVKNRGEPIPAAELPHIFEPLHRAHRGGAHEGSVGLGLYIVDRIVRGHGGHVEVRSSAADGTTFTVALPRRTVPTGQPSQGDAA